ncbi:unnamed protein product, partial [Effrenium voratum]
LSQRALGHGSSPWGPEAERMASGNIESDVGDLLRLLKNSLEEDEEAEDDIRQ